MAFPASQITSFPPGFNTRNISSKPAFLSLKSLNEKRQELMSKIEIGAELKGVIKNKIKTQMVNVFVPTTPNPTSGFLLLVPKSQLKYLNTNIDETVKTIVSAGIIPLNSKVKKN